MSSNTISNVLNESPSQSTPYYMRPPPPPRTAHADIPIKPDLSFLDKSSSDMVYSAYICVNNQERWNKLANFKEHSFMFCEDPVIKELMNKINTSYNGHSGASLGWTMRQLEYIAKYGYTEYRGLFDRNVISQL